MKKQLLLLLITMLYNMDINAQGFDYINSVSARAILEYNQDGNGFFHKKENVSLSNDFAIISVFGQDKYTKKCYYNYKDGAGYTRKRDNVSYNDIYKLVTIYGYNKKTHEAYVETERANCVVVLKDGYHKLIKKNKNIPMLKENDLKEKAAIVSQKLMTKFESLNNKKYKQIADSIEQAKQDSIKKRQEDSLRIVAMKTKEDNYKKTHLWLSVPTKDVRLYCKYCKESIETGDSIFCYKIKDNIVYWRGTKWGRLSIPYDHIHYADIPNSLAKNEAFQYHINIYRDSLENSISSLDVDVAETMNIIKYEGYLNELRKEAPNGLFIDWDWGHEYSSIEFSFKYLNTNKNTIKYIEVFFVVTNDVGDVRKRGSFKGTGPLEEWESASWNWDHSSYYVAGDATRMNISQVVITYMNGSRITIPKSKLRFEN